MTQENDTNPRRGYLRLVAGARCVQQNASPLLMLSEQLQDYLIARTYCNNCPVSRECLEFVNPNPANRFSGTAGGSFWLNGKDVTSKISPDWLAWSGRYRHREVSHVRIRRALLGEIPLTDLTTSDLMVFAYAASEQGVDVRKISRWLGISTMLLYMIIASVEHNAPRDTVTRARTWPMTNGYLKLSPRQLQQRAVS